MSGVVSRSPVTPKLIPAVVGEDRDAHAHLAAQRDERKRFEHAPLREVQGVLRTGDVVVTVLMVLCGSRVATSLPGPAALRGQTRRAQSAAPPRPPDPTLEVLHLLVQ